MTPPGPTEGPAQGARFQTWQGHPRYGAATRDATPFLTIATRVSAKEFPAGDGMRRKLPPSKQLAAFSTAT